MAITLTDNAVMKILSLVTTAPDKGLRVKVIGGGCSGLQYKMDVDEPRAGDKIFERDGAKVVVDRKSFLYLNGTELVRKAWPGPEASLTLVLRAAGLETNGTTTPGTTL